MCDNIHAYPVSGQHPWIRAGSLKDNILFGTPYDPVFYDRVIAACCLNEDIAQLVDGEDTEIGRCLHPHCHPV